MTKSIEGVIFSDESGQDGNNIYGSISIISGPREDLIYLHEELKKVLQRNKTTEIKFHGVTGYRKLKIAKNFIEIGLNFICQRKIWCHVLVWDKTDMRHDVPGRDDLANLCRMYYHNLKQVHKDWKGIENWSFYPDEFSAIEWREDIVEYITKTAFPNEPSLFEQDKKLKSFPNYNKVKGSDSKVMSIIQLADLFAGIVRTSRVNNKEFESFIKEIDGQLSFFEVEKTTIPKNLEYKLELMKFFRNEASLRCLGVNFNKNKYFQTFSKKNNIYIWHYTPQNKYDKAPTK